MEQPIQLDESALDEAIEILNNAQEHSNQNFDQAVIDHDDYDSDSSFEDLEGDFLAITRGIRNQIPLIPPGNQTFEQLPFGLAHAPRDLPQIIQRQANDTPVDEFRNNAHDN